jgi:acetyl esterase/lipase
MKKMAFSLFIVLCIFFNNNCLAQKKVVKLWEGEIPGSIKSPAYCEDSIKLEDGKVRIRKVTDPTLTIYPAPENKATGTAVIICPGGGYIRLAVDNEGEGVVKWLNNAGITAAILKYRLPNDTIMMDKSIGPLQDAQNAVRYLRRNHAEFKISSDKIGVIGFSAGGHLASTLAVKYDEKVYECDSISARPDFSILIYPVISMKPGITHKGSSDCLLGKEPDEKLIEKFSNELHVNKNAPPAFIVHASDDKTVPVQNSIDYFTALRKNNVRAELHIYSEGGHGFGIGKKTTAKYWPEACLNWLRESGF